MLMLETLNAIHETATDEVQREIMGLAMKQWQQDVPCEGTAVRHRAETDRRLAELGTDRNNPWYQLAYKLAQQRVAAG